MARRWTVDELKRKFQEFTKVIWDEEQVDRIGEFVHPDYRANDMIAPWHQSSGADAIRRAIEIYHESFEFLGADDWMPVVEGDTLSGYRAVRARLRGASFPEELQGREIVAWAAGFIEYRDGLAISGYNFISLAQPGLRLLAPVRE